MTRTILYALLLSSCGADPAPPATPGEPARDEPSTEAAAPEEDERARVIAVAEAFVAAQGYTDAPPTVSGDAIVREGIEGTLEDRRGMLQPRAVRAFGGDGGWTVVFAYQSPEHAGRARALVIREGAPPSFVHQDMLLEPLGAE
ncbi:MAG: hypothetical protein M5U28_16385 [Sandaracinaceae bacterium]|nr:hypothetical protein [Sandaracinaceae bacterium]